jgi:hypothetical protein
MSSGGSKRRARSKGALLFATKKAPKNFDFFDETGTVPHGREAEQTFFGSFFQKRTSSFFCISAGVRKVFLAEVVKTSGLGAGRRV